MFRRLFLSAGLVALSPVAAYAQDAANLTWAAIYAQQSVAPAQVRPARPMRAHAPLPIARSSVARLVEMSARAHGVPVRLALGVAQVESGFRCNAVGAANERGPLQIMPATARGLGYRGAASGLTNCGAGLHYGMRHLAMAYRRCGTVHGAKRLHNRGLGASCHGATAYTQRVARAMARL